MFFYAGSVILAKSSTSSSFGKYFNFKTSSFLYLISIGFCFEVEALEVDFFNAKLVEETGSCLILLKYFSNSDVKDR